MSASAFGSMKSKQNILTRDYNDNNNDVKSCQKIGLNISHKKNNQTKKKEKEKIWSQEVEESTKSQECNNNTRQGLRTIEVYPVELAQL